MAISQRDTETPQSLEECQDYILGIMEDIQSIWAKLQAGEWPKTVKSQAEYETWVKSTNAAYIHKGKRLDWLNDFCMRHFGISYPKKRALLIAIQERMMNAPAFLLDENSNGHEEPSAKAEPEEEPAPSVPEIVLSVQSERQLEGILKRLIEARKTADMTQDDVASYFGFHNTAIGQWERGRTPITLLNLFKLANIYECDPLWILTGEREVTKEQLGAIAENLEISLGKLWDLMGKQE